MALILKDRVKETSSSSGTGSITLGGAFPGYQTFNAAIASGSTVYYTIHNLTAGSDGEWEVGLGTFTSTATLSRDTVLSSSTGAKVNFTAGASGLEVFITQPAEEAVYLNQASGLVEVGGNGTNTVSFTNINTTNLTANTVTLTAGTISTNAANATDITNKTYVDNLFSTGITYHDPVLVESPTALTATYNQPGGAGNGVGATLTNSGANVALSIDGVSLSNTARVLVYTQSNAVQNGVYTVTNPGNVSAQWVLTRATDADTYGVGDPNKLGQGDAFFVQSGNTGAGETYILNTVGTITFGTTNLTFAQISSAQVYSAGTGLNLTNLAFSVANTAVTAAQYGNDGAVGQFTVNAQGQLTNAANVSINASSISVGTLANGRTTAASANGASTIVARDANGNFTANVITATTSNATTFNGTTGNFTNISGNGVALTAINASNITSGTIANARTTASDANSASTLVVRDANGAFAAGNVTAANFIGAGATITSINASNISSGTIANARTTAASANGASTIVQRDSGGNFAAATITAAVIGDLSGGSNINASNIASGTIANARTTAATANGASTIVLRGASGEFAAGAITGTSFSGNGSALTAINATAITTGTLDNARTNATSANGASTLVVRDANGSFAGNVITGTTGTFTSVSGNGVALTAINASNIASGTIANARTTASDANGASTIVSRDANGSFAANVITATTISGNGASLTNINASNVSTGTIANARTTAATANGASTIVLRGTSGEFSAGAITGASFTGDGAAISAINASNVSTGTIANARTTGASANGASTLVLRDANGSFAGNVVTATTGTFTSVSGNGVALTAINASNVTSGTLDNARTTAASANGASTIIARDANGSFTANVVNVTTLSGGAVSGNGSALTAINASNISSGTIANARTTAATANGASTIVLRGTSGEFSAGAITGASFTGSGSGLTSIPNSATTAASANGASTIVARDANGSFAANVGTFTTISGAGGGLTSINASNISSGTIANARTTASDANGASTIVARDANGSFTTNIITANGSAISAINGSNVTTGTVANARTSAATANGASTIVLRGTSGEFTAGAITGASFTGSGSGLTSIPNSATTAASANGASTIVARDANGSFAGNVVTATTGTFTNLSGNGATLTAINASNISSGTIANARTTGTDAATASTIVLRDANASFSGNVITATNLSGAGTSITSINGSNVTTGTVANARTTASDANGASTIVSRSAAGSFAGNVGTFNGVTVGATNSSFDTNVLFVDATNNRVGIGTSSPTYKLDVATIAAAISQSGGVRFGASDQYGFRLNQYTTGGGVPYAQIMGPQDSNGWLAFTQGTADAERMRIHGTGGVSIGNTTDPGATNLSVTGTIAGNGAPLTAINASNISSGTIANARTTASDANGASTIVSRDANGSFTANVVTATNFIGGGASISAINGSNVTTGTVANARTSAATANGASTIVLRGTSGEFSAGAITSVSISGNGVALTAINASNIASGTIANARTTADSANGASTIVARDANGSFTANVGTFTTVSGAGGGLTGINASNLSSGTVATARLASGTANSSTYLRGDQTWATVTSGITLTNDTTTNATYYVTLTTATSGSISAANVSNTKLFFNPSTGTLTSTVHTSNSDERLKENWTDVTPDFISKLAQVKHGVFSRKDCGNREPGVSAQSFITVLPEAVVEGADGYLSVNYGGAALVSAIELAKVVERLQAEIAELRAELKAK